MSDSDPDQADPSPLQLRDELETMVLKELLGPGSAEEEIIESPGTRYFVGVLAPRKRAKAGAAPAKAAVVPPPPAEDEEETRTAKSSTATNWPSVAGTPRRTARPIRPRRRTRP